MEHESPEPSSSEPARAAGGAEGPRLPLPWSFEDAAPTRHDGWTGERMAKFCEVLAETGLVVDACLAAGKSTNTAYATRRRNPVFAAAWDAALTIARERLADTLLARSIEGVTEQYFKDGTLVGEKKLVDSRLGLAILRRLDRMAETGSPLHASVPNPARPGPGRVVAVPPGKLDWDLALTALRSADPGDVAEALAMLRQGDAHEAHDPPIHTPSCELCATGDGRDDGLDLSDRCWKDEDGNWMTDFPPPPGFDGYRIGEWGDGDYRRACTDEEIAVLAADEAVAQAAERAEDEALRDAWFALLRGELESEAGEDHSTRHAELDSASIPETAQPQDGTDTGSAGASPFAPSREPE